MCVALAQLKGAGSSVRPKKAGRLNVGISSHEKERCWFNSNSEVSCNTVERKTLLYRNNISQVVTLAN